MSLILTDIHQRICTITFNRPEKKNAFNRSGWFALRDAVVEARNNDAVCCLCCSDNRRGQGFFFRRGFMDLTGEPGEKPPFEVMMDEMMLLDKPLLAAAKGVAIGFGATALFHCDVVYVGESLRMRLPFVNLGLVPRSRMQLHPATQHRLPTSC